jgi:hypothetical protein
MCDESSCTDRDVCEERSCCAEVNNSGCSSCANLSTCVLNLVVASETYACERRCSAEVNDCVWYSWYSCAYLSICLTDPVARTRPRVCERSYYAELAIVCAPILLNQYMYDGHSARKERDVCEWSCCTEANDCAWSSRAKLNVCVMNLQ